MKQKKPIKNKQQLLKEDIFRMIKETKNRNDLVDRLVLYVENKRVIL